MATVGEHFPEARDYLYVYDRAGGLGHKALLADAIHLSAREVARMVETDSAVAHCPVSNMFIRSGRHAHRALPRRGPAHGSGHRRGRRPGTVGHHADAPGLFQHNSRAVVAGYYDRAKTAGLFRTGTLRRAEVLGFDDVIGSLEAGKEADLIAIDPELERPPTAGACRA